MEKYELLREYVSRLNDIFEYKRYRFSRNDADKMMDALSDIIIDALHRRGDDRVPLPGIGAFLIKHTPERKGILNGEEWVSPEKDEIYFRIKESLRDVKINDGSELEDVDSQSEDGVSNTENQCSSNEDSCVESE